MTALEARRAALRAILVEAVDKMVPILIPEEFYPVCPTFDLVVEEAARNFNVEVVDLLGRERKHPLDGARRIAIYATHQILGLSYSELGRQWGRDHTTVMNAIRVVEDALARETGSEREQNIARGIRFNVNNIIARVDQRVRRK